ncbi:DUF6339 family protein [Amycolatopsis jiangsuensis]|uniref:Uncharacterized protein n=1 Tax=Amycolatopsis jiangsuensis TaxID=1181879 RepID=A0A840IX37_9PSEU|nr:DUF6339 family protein [Amycolatopsis jiangsuensis]MBB4687361.1 hypothetical protein [Amycolatopsis jiangsuensis]
MSSSILYPRLLDAAAMDMHRTYTHLTIEELKDRHAYQHPSAVFAATGGDRVARQSLENLRERVLKVAEEAGFPSDGRRRDHTEFDLDIARLLHERMGLVAAEAAVRPIWAFLALVVLPDVSYWRYRDPPIDRILGTDITRHVWGRLWWRAHLLTIPNETDQYRLLRTFNESDFDQIYARRSLLGGSRSVVRALADVWPSVNTGGFPPRRVLRDVLKRILRAAAIIEFDSLDYADLCGEIRREAATSVAAMRDENRRVP